MQVFSKTVIDTIAMFSTDRGVTGQAGVSVDRSTEPSDEFPAALAAKILATDDAIDHVFVASNQVAVRRSGGWDDAVLESVSAVITDFFVFYDEA